MRIMIVDDEAPARMRLRRLIEELGEYQVVGEAANGREALLRYGELNPDILLMDIRMPGMDGLEAAKHLSALPDPPAVIFTTAYSDHALAAFEAHAVGYLLKPVRKERLDEALKAVRRLTRSQVESVHAQEGRARSHICAYVRGNLQLIPVSRIRHFQADQKYVTVRFPEGRVLIEESLKALEEEFGDSFIRIHRNALVACAYVTGLEKTAEGSYQVRLQDIPEPLEVSRRHVAAVRRKFKELAI